MKFTLITVVSSLLLFFLTSFTSKLSENPPEKQWEYYKHVDEHQVYFALENYEGQYYMFVRYGLDSEEEQEYQVILTKEELFDEDCTEHSLSNAIIEARLVQLLDLVLDCTKPSENTNLGK